MRKELLIPVGDYESLECAIASGADAVYLGLKKFNARGYAANFTSSEVEKATRLCHLYGVKIYITMNVMVKDEEVDDFLGEIRFLHKLGVDAVIMQDFGLMYLVREKFPNLEIHASTQANACSLDAISLLHEIGVKRVVLPREMSLEEIENISVPIEKEVFIHGALCISYSGRCLMSSMIGARSANRGECTGCCRLPYTLYKRDKKLKEGYLLSTKELNTSPYIEDLLNSSIDSFKVEGRMKSAAYVGFITSFYRRLIDKTPFSYEEELDKLKILFNREFTTGRLFSDDIRNSVTSNHLGLKIGQVIAINKKRIKIRLAYPLYQEDGIRFQKAQEGFVANFIYDEKGRLISRANANDIIELDNKIHLVENDTVYKTTSKYLLQSLSSLKMRKIPISFSVVAKINMPLEITITDKKNTIVEKLEKVEMAKTAPITKEQITRQLGKLGNTPFILENIDIDMDNNIFISIHTLNELRRMLTSKLSLLREEEKSSFLEKDVLFSKLEVASQSEFCVEVQNEEQLKVALKMHPSRIYLPADMYKKYAELPNCFSIEAKKKQEAKSLLHQTYKKPEYESISDYTFNVANIYTIYYLLKLGYKRVTLSVELSNKEIIHLFTHFKEVFHFIPSLEVIIYNRVVVMDIKENIFDIEESHFSYFLKDYQQRKFPIVYQDGYTYLYNYEIRERKIEELLSYPFSMRFSFSTEGEEEMFCQLQKYL